MMLMKHIMGYFMQKAKSSAMRPDVAPDVQRPNKKDLKA